VTTVSLQLLGVPQLNGKPLERKTAALLTLLSFQPEVSRAKLAAWLWGDSSSGRNNLRQVLFKLPKGLLLGDSVLKLSSEVMVDIKTQPIPDGDILGIFEYTDCPEFSDWLLETRTEIRVARLLDLSHLSAALETRGEFETALEYAQQILSADSLSETNYVRVIRLHLAIQDKAAALKCFDECAKMLRFEFGLEPSPTTLVLLRQARQVQPVLNAEQLELLQIIAILDTAYNSQIAALMLGCSVIEISQRETKLETSLGSDPQKQTREHLKLVLAAMPTASRRAWHMTAIAALEQLLASPEILATQQLLAGLENQAIISLQVAFTKAREAANLADALGFALRAASVQERLGQRQEAFATLYAGLGCASGGSAGQQQRMVAKLHELALTPIENAKAQIAEFAWQIRMGQLEAAKNAVRRARNAAKASTDLGLEAEVLTVYAESLLQTNLPRDALAPLEAAQVLALQTENTAIQFQILLIQAKVFHRLGKHELAINDGRKALELANKTNQFGWRGHAINDLASHLIAAEQAQEARDLLEFLVKNLRRASGAEAYLAISLSNLMKACTQLNDPSAVQLYAQEAIALKNQLSLGNQKKLEQILSSQVSNPVNAKSVPTQQTRAVSDHAATA
jgi:DNA-binding SARP family transcriptional activator